jgi:hypothetical protein
MDTFQADTFQAARLGSLDKPLDFNLHANEYGEIMVPFAHYVVPPEPILAPSERRAFPQFCSLPAELQLRIIHLCDVPTLW